MPEVCPPGAPSRTPCRETPRGVPTLAASLCRLVAPMSSTLQSGSATVRHMADTKSQNPALVAGMPRIKLEMRAGSFPRGCVRDRDRGACRSADAGLAGGPGPQKHPRITGNAKLLAAQRRMLIKSTILLLQGSLAAEASSSPRARCSLGSSTPSELESVRCPLRPSWFPPRCLSLSILVAGCLFHPCAHWPSRWPGRPFAGLVQAPACRTV